MGPLHHFLGINATTTTKGLCLSKKAYITNLLHQTDMVGSKPESSTMSPSSTLSKLNGTPLTDPTNYRCIIGALLITHPNLTFLSTSLPNSCHGPPQITGRQSNSFFSISRRHPHQGIHIQSAPQFTLNVYIDIDWVCSIGD